MQPMISYLDPKRFFPKPQLDGVLILLPSYIQPEPLTRTCLEQAMHCGAEICASYGCSDPALHRCLIAAKALQVIAKGEGRIKHIMWIDDDMAFSPSHLAFMRAQCDELASSVTGAYCKRGNSSRICLRALGAQVREVHGVPESIRVQLDADCLHDYLPDNPELWPDADYFAYPVTAGMGCLMVPVSHFVRHCAAVPQVTWNSAENEQTIVPGICESAMMQDGDGVFGWVSEDVNYSEGLWATGSGLWTCPIVFGHISHVPLVPNHQATWLGERGSPILIPHGNQSVDANDRFDSRLVKDPHV